MSVKSEQNILGNVLKKAYFIHSFKNQNWFLRSWQLFYKYISNWCLYPPGLPRKISYPQYLCFCVPSKIFWQRCKWKVRDVQGWLWGVLWPVALSEVSGWTEPAALPPQRQMFTGVPWVSNPFYIIPDLFLCCFSLKFRSIIKLSRKTLM